LSRYTAITPEDLAAMLGVIGVGSLQEIFERQIPQGVRLERELDLPAGLGEQDVYEHLRELAARNTSVEEELSFLGAGMYDHYVPALIDMLLERSEFLTPYTPYQPEISQGGLQVMFEYQTAICELTGLPVSNASVYEGPSAVAAAGYLAKLHNGGGRFVVSAGLHPHSLQTLRTYAHGYGVEVVEVPLTTPDSPGGQPGAGVTDPDAWARAIAAGGGDTSAAIFAQPNFYGAVEDAAALSAAAKAAGGPAGGADAADAAGGAGGAGGAPIIIAQVDPITLGILAPPGECGVDVAVGEGQPLGNRLDFGGPSFGMFAAREEYLRRMPGRIAGETVDVDGRRGFVLTLQTREQHIRRSRATSNICTNQSLLALAFLVYATTVGPKGLATLQRSLSERARTLAAALGSIDGLRAPRFDAPYLHEFTLGVSRGTATGFLDRLRRAKVLGGHPLRDPRPGAAPSEELVLTAATEFVGEKEIAKFAKAARSALAHVPGAA
jgi:glycine dehydrogenase subunit 1